MSESLTSLDEFIQSSRDVREMKRALCVKMYLNSVAVVEICQLMQVSQPFVSKWHGIYQAQGAQGLRLGYRGSQSYLAAEQRLEALDWLRSQTSPDVSGLRDYLADRYGVVYQSKQSYYTLMQAAGLSYHKSEKRNPNRDPELVQQRREEIKKNWRSTKPR